MDKKNGQPPKETDRNTRTNSTPAIRRLSPREARLLAALLCHLEGLSREAVDRATPASNGPHYVEQLREKLGLQIPCRRVDREKLAKLGLGVR